MIFKTHLPFAPVLSYSLCSLFLLPSCLASSSLPLSFCLLISSYLCFHFLFFSFTFLFCPLLLCNSLMKEMKEQDRIFPFISFIISSFFPSTILPLLLSSSLLDLFFPTFLHSSPLFTSTLILFSLSFHFLSLFCRCVCFLVLYSTFLFNLLSPSLLHCFAFSASFPPLFLFPPLHLSYPPFSFLLILLFHFLPPILSSTFCSHFLFSPFLPTHVLSSSSLSHLFFSTPCSLHIFIFLVLFFSSFPFTSTSYFSPILVPFFLSPAVSPFLSSFLLSSL